MKKHMLLAFACSFITALAHGQANTTSANLTTRLKTVLVNLVHDFKGVPRVKNTNIRFQYLHAYHSWEDQTISQTISAISFFAYDAHKAEGKKHIALIECHEHALNGTCTIIIKNTIPEIGAELVEMVEEMLDHTICHKGYEKITLRIHKNLEPVFSQIGATVITRDEESVVMSYKPQNQRKLHFYRHYTTVTHSAFLRL